MNASFQYVLRNLGRRRTRTLIGVLGVFITLAFLTTIQIGLDTISISYIDLVALQAGKADLSISKKGGSLFQPLPFDPAEVQSRLATNSHLRGLAPRFLGLARVAAGGSEQFAVLIGLDPDRERELDIWGLEPASPLHGAVCALSKSLAEKIQAKTGGSISVRSIDSSSSQALTLETVVERQLILPQQIRDYVVVNQTTVRTLLNEPTRVQLLAGAFKNPQSYYDARDLHASVLQIKDAGTSISEQLGMDYEVRLPKATAITAFQQFASPLRAVFGVFALLALTIIGLLIYSLISVSVEERIREYAILKTLGSKNRDIFRLVLSESFLICFMGVVPGVFAGAFFAKVGVKLIALVMGSKGAVANLNISPATFWITIAGGVVLSIGSALLPAMHATRWKIVDALDPSRRGQIQPEPRERTQGSRGLIITGLALSALSVVVFFVLPGAFLSGNPSLIGSVVLCLLLSILFGFTLAMVGLLPYLQRLLMLLGGWVFGPVSELAGRNLERHRRRHGTTALLFTLSVAMVIFLASLVALFSRTAEGLVEQLYGADIRIQAPTGNRTVASELARVDGVQNVSQVKFLRGRTEQGVAYEAYLSDIVGMKTVWMVPYGVDTNLHQVLYTHQIGFDSGAPSALPALANRKVGPSDDRSPDAPGLILSTAVAKFLDVKQGQQVQLTFLLGAERKEARFRVEAICSSMPGLQNFRSRVAYATGAGALLSLDNFEAMTASAPDEAFQSFYFIRAGSDPQKQKEAARRIREQFDARYRFGVQCTAEQKDAAKILYWTTQVLFGLLLAVAVVIAVFALIASMTSTVLERHREIGVLKALGLRRAELFRLFLAESVVLTVSSGIAGGTIGFLLAWMFVLQASALMERPGVFTMPYLTFLALLLISVSAGAIAAWLPTRNLLRKSAAEILRT